MTTAQIVVTLAGAGAVAFVAWFFWLKKEVGTRAALTSGGWQEQMVLVKGGYTPDTIVARSGTPLRLIFDREESSPCSEMVIFDAFGKSAKLPERTPVAVELMPNEPGEYPFTCQMGMLRGLLIVEEVA
jgi:plastocyanin domain-containing protein